MPSSNENGLAEAERRIAKAKLTGKTVLYLSDLGLEVLPESIGRLAQLRFLYLNDNRLTQLPKSIGRLTQLPLLFLGHNQLTQLPESIGQLLIDAAKTVAAMAGPIIETVEKLRPLLGF